MIDLILLGILTLGLLTGLRRGFVLQLFHLVGFVIALIIAVVYYDNLAVKLDLWIPYPDLPEGEAWAIFLDTLPLEAAFYNAIAFAVLFFGTKIILQIIASMLDFVADLPIINSVNGLLGAILGFVETYFILFIFLYIAALAPVPFVQGILDKSAVAGFMIEHTPIISTQIKNLWFEHIVSAMK